MFLKAIMKVGHFFVVVQSESLVVFCKETCNELYWIWL